MSRTTSRPLIARMIRTLAVPIILGWLGLIVVFSTVVPQLEEVGRTRAVSMNPDAAPSMISFTHISEVFNEGNSNSAAMIVLEGQSPLGDDAHAYYDEMVAKLRADKHVLSVQDFWGDPLTSAGAQSNDGKATFVQVKLAGNMGEAMANESVQAVQDIIKGLSPPPGVKTYVTGPSALASDQQMAGDRSLKVMEAVTFTVIIVVLLLVYRSVTTLLIMMVMVVFSLTAARGTVAFLGYHGIIGLTIFATNLLVMLAIAAATDYAIFLIGRYQEARGAGEDRESAYYTMFGGTAHVVLGSGLTVAGATFCLSFTRLPYFQTLGVPLAIGMLVVVITSLVVGPAIISVASRFGKLLEPKRAMRVRQWRKIGAAIVAWPGPILVGATALALVGLITLPGYRTNYNDRAYLPASLAANEGYAAADRHFSSARMNPEILMVESDHDLRNPADFLVIDKIAKAIFRVEGISRVQAITRPDGKPIKHTSIPFQISMQGTAQKLTQKYQSDMTANMLKQVDGMEATIHQMERMQGLTQQMSDVTLQMAAVTHQMVGQMKTMVGDVKTMRDSIANFDDFFRPIRNYFYWEPHCFDIPVCWAMRSVFDTLDGIDTMTDNLDEMLPVMERLDALMPQMTALMPQMTAMMPEMIANMRDMQTQILSMQSTQKGLQDQMESMQGDSAAMGEAFDASMNDDSFYLPPEVFDNPDFQRGMKQFLSPDGHAVRFIISHDGDPLSPEGIARIDKIKTAVKEAIKATPLEGSTIYLGGTAAMFKDMSEGNAYDLIIAGIASLCLIFIIMLILTRAVVAAAVIVGTVVLSLGASFGLSVLIWQHIIGIELHWMVLAMSVIILLAVGADYNLLLVARMKEEIHAGIKTGIIRAMGGSGSVVTSAGLVFAFTMLSMVVSELTMLAQVGSTIGLGLLFDTLIIRSFMTPSIAALMGRWFWWPQKVRTRPVPAPWPSPAAPLAVTDPVPAPSV